MRSFVLPAIAATAVLAVTSLGIASDANAATRVTRHVVHRTHVAPFTRAYNFYGGPAIYGGSGYVGSRGSYGPVVNGVAFPPSGGAP